MADALPLLGYAQPINPAFTISGTGAAFVTDQRFGDGNPGVMTRIQWLSSGSPAIGQYVEIRADFTRPLVPRIASLLGMRRVGGLLLPGQRVSILGKRAGDPGFTYDLGGDSQSLRTSLQWNGALGAWWHLAEGLDPIIGWAVRLYNDFDGGTDLTADDFLDLGSIAPQAAVAFHGTAGRWNSVIDPTEKTRTKGSQMHRSVGVPYRSITFGIAPMGAQDAFLDGLSGGTNFQSVAYAMSRGNPCSLMRRPGTDLQQAESIFGVAEQVGGSEDMAYRLSRSTDWRIDEVPAQPA